MKEEKHLKIMYRTSMSCEAILSSQTMCNWNPRRRGVGGSRQKCLKKWPKFFQI